MTTYNTKASFPEPTSLAQLVSRFGGEAVGRKAPPTLEAVAPLAEASPQEVAPLFEARYVDEARDSGRAGVILTSTKLAPRLDGAALWVHPEPRILLALVLESIAAEGSKPPGAPRHPSAIVDSTAQIGTSVCLAELVIVGRRTVVGQGCRLGPRVTLGREVRLGSDCVLGAGSMVLDGCILGDRVRLGPGAIIGADGFGFVPWGRGDEHLRVPQLGIVEIGDDVDIGAGTTIDRATLGKTVIGRGAKVDNLVQVGHNVTVGSDAMLAAQTGLAGSSKVGSGALVGGQVGLADHAEIGPGARVAGKSGVTSDIPGGQTYAGYPAVPRLKWLRLWARLLGRNRR